MIGGGRPVYDIWALPPIALSPKECVALYYPPITIVNSNNPRIPSTRNELTRRRKLNTSSFTDFSGWRRLLFWGGWLKHLAPHVQPTGFPVNLFALKRHAFSRSRHMVGWAAEFDRALLASYRLYSIRWVPGIRNHIFLIIIFGADSSAV